MKKILTLFLIVLSVCLMSCENEKTKGTVETLSKPNILLIVADDLGFTDLGCYGGEIKTPHLDALAKEGVRNTSFYTAPTCSPTRAMLLSGVTTHRNGYGTMEGDWADNQKGLKGYEGHLNFDVVAFPKLLQDGGYHTSIAGKWHQAFPAPTETQWPNKRGFDRSFCLLQGGAGHFEDKQPLLSFMKSALYAADGKMLDNLPKGFYSSKVYADKTIDYINESQEQKKPFFSFLSFTAPHWPLQVSDEHIDLYKGQYDEGYEVLAQKRLTKAMELGVVPKTRLPALTPNVIPWAELSDTDKKISSRKMEVYAAMIERLDANVGRVIAHLKSIGQYENTMIVFMADNGAEGNSIFGYEGTGEWVAKTFDNSLENMGRQNSYIELGAAWAQVSSLPFKWYKAFATEGGVRAPAFICYPKWKHNHNTINNNIISVMDLAPTFLELAGVEHPDTIYKGRKIYPMDGLSMIDWLAGKTQSVHDSKKAHVWELYGRRGVRKGVWKAEWLEKPYGNNEWELYQLEKDITQRENLAKLYPDVLKSLIADWEVYAKRNNVTLPDRPTAYATESVWRK